MSQQIKVERNIEFSGAAGRNKNVKGDMNPERLFAEYNFTELALDATNKYTLFIDTDSTIASGSGGALLTTLATDTRVASISCGGIWHYPVMNPVVEMKFKVDVITTLCINAGFTDAASYATTVMPFTVSGTTISDNNTNGAMFCFDTDQTTKYYYGVYNNAGTHSGSILASTIAPVAATNATIRIKIDSAGNAYYYYNGTLVKYQALAVATTVPLIPYFGIKTKSAAAKVATLRYVRAWGDA